jgi:hypothetical protein
LISISKLTRKRHQAIKSPIATQVFAALLINVTEDHWVLNFNPGVAFIVTPTVAGVIVV